MDDGQDLRWMVGRLVQSVRRIWYVGPDGRLTDEGPVEIGFADGAAVVLCCGSDGQSLRVTEGPWADAFAPPLDADNDEFVRTSGKWTAFNVSDVPPYSHLIGEPVREVVPMVSGPVQDTVTRVWGETWISGLDVVTDAATLSVRIDGDETEVSAHRGRQDSS